MRPIVVLRHKHQQDPRITFYRAASGILYQVDHINDDLAYPVTVRKMVALVVSSHKLGVRVEVY